MSDVRSLVRDARSLGASFVVSGESVKVAAPAPLLEKLREHRAALLEYLRLDFEPWALREWRKVSIPGWRRILDQAIKAMDGRREEYARWMLREVLLDPEYEEPAR